MGNSNISAWRENTIDGSSVIRVENGNARSISSTQPTWSNYNEKYRAQGANERQEINTFIVTSESENVGDLDKDEFRVSRDFRAYDFNDTRPTTCGEHREHEQNSKNYVNSKNRGPSVSRLSDVSDNTMSRWRVSTSPDDRLSLPSAKRQWDKTTQPLHLTVIISQGRTSKFIAASTCQAVADLKSQQQSATDRAVFLTTVITMWVVCGHAIHPYSHGTLEHRPTSMKSTQWVLYLSVPQLTR